MRNTPFPVLTSRYLDHLSLNDASLIEGGQNPDSYAETVPGPPPGVRQFMPEIRQRRVSGVEIPRLRKAGKLDLAVKYGRRLC